MTSKAIKFLHIVFLWMIWVIIFSVSFARKIWGEIDLAQLLFFMQTDLDGVDRHLLFKGILHCFLLPFIAVLVMYGLMWLMLKLNKWIAYFSMFFIDLFLVLGALICSEKCFSSNLSFEKINFYEEKYVDIGDVQQSQSRNLIIVFAESLEKQMVSDVNTEFDKDAVKFDDLAEGYAQRWTQGALFSAFTGVHIHYLSEYLRYALYDKVKWGSFNPEMDIVASHKVGQNFDFNMPNIRVLSDITKEHGYQNLFVQGGGIKFSGTDRFLKSHGFDKHNVYGLLAFSDNKDFEYGKGWWGVDDASMFRLFKEKISQLDENKPFFAVAFTLDLHYGKNPYFENEDEVILATINNLDDFIRWYKEQDFYENTTLVIVGDHKRMGENAKHGGDIYNAFFNLPDNLKENLNIHRKFNQIDMFPTLLEIMGFVVPLHKAGMGTSLFSDEKTLAEEYSYDEQAKIFGKLDPFYHKLWSSENIFNNK